MEIEDEDSHQHIRISRLYHYHRSCGSHCDLDCAFMSLSEGGTDFAPMIVCNKIEVNKMDLKTKSGIYYIIGYLEGVANNSPSDGTFDCLQKPIVMLRELIGMKEEE